MILYRPVGPAELELISGSGFRAFPPRLPEQPIFYPVLTFAYAERIARDWNSTSQDNDFKGYVTQFSIDDPYAEGFPVRDAGGSKYQELWVPAEELEEFNRHIIGDIMVVAEYFRRQKL